MESWEHTVVEIESENGLMAAFRTWNEKGEWQLVTVHAKANGAFLLFLRRAKSD